MPGHTDSGAYLLLMARQGRLSVRQAGRQAEVVPGQLLLLDGSRPFHTRHGTPPDGADDAPRTIVLRLAHELISLPAYEVEHLLAVPLDTRGGMGAVLARWLSELAEQYGHEPFDGPRPLSAADVRAVAAATATLVTALLAQHTAEQGPPGGGGLYGQIRQFVQGHLADPELSPHSVAAAHHISVRQLHKLFQSRGTTIGSVIRQCRLARCRSCLADPALRTMTVQAIAVRWGFTDAAHFSRLFRAAYGLPPREYRRLALRKAPSTGEAVRAPIVNSRARTCKTAHP